MPITLSTATQEKLRKCFSNSRGDTRAFDLFIPPLGGDRRSVISEQRLPLGGVSCVSK